MRRSPFYRLTIICCTSFRKHWPRSIECKGSTCNPTSLKIFQRSLRVLSNMPLQNLALGANRFDLAHAFDLPDCRVGLGWNGGMLPTHLPPLTDGFAASDHTFEAACAALQGEMLLIAFSAQGPGMQQWHAPAAALRAWGLQLDALYVADPSNSFYLQDPLARGVA